MKKRKSANIKIICEKDKDWLNIGFFIFALSSGISLYFTYYEYNEMYVLITFFLGCFCLLVGLILYNLDRQKVKRYYGTI